MLKLHRLALVRQLITISDELEALKGALTGGGTAAVGQSVFYSVIRKNVPKRSLTQMWVYTVTCRLLLQIIWIRYKGLINTIFQNNQHPVHFI